MQLHGEVLLGSIPVLNKKETETMAGLSCGANLRETNESQGLPSCQRTGGCKAAQTGRGIHQEDSSTGGSEADKMSFRQMPVTIMVIPDKETF